MLGFALLGGLVISVVIGFGVYVASKAIRMKNNIHLKGDKDA
jgi:hypothetical protein